MALVDPLLGNNGQPQIAAVQDADWWTKLGKYMPTGTFFVFQAVAPFITNNGNCGAGLEWHKIVTGVVLLVLAAVCMFLAFTDSIVVDNTLYYGVATSSSMRILYPKRTPPPALGDLTPYKISELSCRTPVWLVIVSKRWLASYLTK